MELYVYVRKYMLMYGVFLYVDVFDTTIVEALKRALRPPQPSRWVRIWGQSFALMDTYAKQAELDDYKRRNQRTLTQ